MQVYHLECQRDISKDVYQMLRRCSELRFRKLLNFPLNCGRKSASLTKSIHAACLSHRSLSARLGFDLTIVRTRPVGFEKNATSSCNSRCTSVVSLICPRFVVAIYICTLGSLSSSSFPVWLSVFLSIGFVGSAQSFQTFSKTVVHLCLYLGDSSFLLRELPVHPLSLVPLCGGKFCRRFQWSVSRSILKRCWLLPR